MTKEWLSRAEMLIGHKALLRLQQSRVLIVGLGGVGGTTLEHLCRAGVGHFTLIDGDVFQTSNRNRQILALDSTLGQSKAEVAAARCRDINPEADLKVVNQFVTGDDIEKLLQTQHYDYVVDAIDTLSPKVNLIETCTRYKIPVVSSMGAGGKLDVTQVRVADISKSYNDKLARALRKRLHRLGIRKGIKAVFSPEGFSGELVLTEGEQNKKSNVGTISYMPPMFGLVCAQTVIQDLIEGLIENKQSL